SKRSLRSGLADNTAQGQLRVSNLTLSPDMSVERAGGCLTAAPAHNVSHDYYFPFRNFGHCCYSADNANKSNSLIGQLIIVIRIYTDKYGFHSIAFIPGFGG
ncbi:MAG: hypothetical protein AAF487_15045, partial [Bacteroidota bacterium]